MSQLITGNYVIKFERNSFRVQLSARGIATCFASAQPSQKVKQQPLWQVFWHLQVIALKTGALLVAQALLQLTAKLAQQANSLCSVKMLWLTAHCFASQTGYYTRKLACFYRQHCPLEACLPMAFACCTAANLPSC